MKKIIENQAKYYNYISNVFTTVTNYYNYNYLKVPIFKENSSILTSSVENIKNYYFNNLKKGFKKYCYDGLILDDKNEINALGSIVLDVDTLYQDAEFISMFYRIIEELGFEELIVKISANKDYDLAKLENCLDSLEVLYEIDDSSINNILEFRIEYEDNVLSYGLKNIKDITYIEGYINTDKVVDLISQEKELDNHLQVFIVASTEEERLTAMKLAQDLRWCEFSVYVDTTNLTHDKQMEMASSSNANMIVLINEENLKKGIITVRDNYLKEDTKVDENEIIDYIASNL